MGAGKPGGSRGPSGRNGRFINFFGQLNVERISR